jgi:hypothetical protein
MVELWKECGIVSENIKILSLRMLVSHSTNHVVWVRQEPAPRQFVPRRIPNVEKNLDYVVFQKRLSPREFNWYKEFINYRLVKPHGLPTLEFEDIPEEYRAETKLARAKCYAMSAVIDAVSITRERQDLIYNPLTDLDNESIINVYQRTLNLDYASAKILAEFKKEELRFSEQTLKANELEAEILITNAKTVEELVEIKNHMAGRFMVSLTSEFDEVV